MEGQHPARVWIHGGTDWGSEGSGDESGEDDNGEGVEAHHWFGLEGTQLVRLLYSSNIV